MARGLPAPGKGGEGAWREGGTHPRSDHRGSRSPPRGGAGAARRPACRGGLGRGWGLPAPHLTSPPGAAPRGLSAPPPCCEGREREGRRRVTVTPAVTPPHPSPARAGGERSALPGGAFRPPGAAPSNGPSPPPSPQAAARPPPAFPRAHPSVSSQRRRRVGPQPPKGPRLPPQPDAHPPGTGVCYVVGLHASPRPLAGGEAPLQPRS